MEKMKKKKSNVGEKMKKYKEKEKSL